MARNSSPQSIADILKNTLKKMQIDQPMKKYSIWNYWAEIVGPKIASKAQPLRVQDNTLVVGVISHAWMTELTHMKTMLLKKIQEKIEKCPIQNIRFEINNTSRPSSINK